MGQSPHVFSLRNVTPTLTATAAAGLRSMHLPFQFCAACRSTGPY